MADFQCKAWAELGNAYRVADRLDSAHMALSYAEELYEHGTGDKALGIRLLDFQASLAGDCRKFGLACNTLSLIHEHHSIHGDSHLAGRALIGKGLYTGYAGRPEEAIQLLRDGFALIEKGLDPNLTCIALNNQVTFLVDCQRFREAKKILFINRQNLSLGVGRMVLLRVRWEEGRIDAGLGKLMQAEQAFRDVKRDSEEVFRPFDAALVSLDLATVLMLQNRVAEAETLVVEAARVFVGLRIDREALGAVLLLKKSFEMRYASAALVEEVAVFVRRAQYDPNARFDPKPL